MKFLSYGGGRQTATILAMIVNGDFEKPDHIIFSDTQSESRSTYAYNEFAKIQAKKLDIPFHTVTAGNIMADSVSGDRFASIPFFTLLGGQQGMLRRQCTNEYKIQPVYKKIKEIMGIKPYERYKGNAEIWIGYSMGEMKRVQRFQDAPRPKWITGRFPLIEKKMHVDACLNYLRDNHWGMPDKSACIMCPFKSDIMWRELKTNYPEEFQRACDYEKQVNAIKQRFDSKVFLHRSLVPLGRVDFTSQVDFFDCKWGVCGL